MVEEVHQIIWSAMALINIEQIGVDPTWSALGQQIDCQLLPSFNIISQIVYFANPLVQYRFSIFYVVYCSLLQSNLLCYNCVWTILNYLFVPTHHWLLSHKLSLIEKKERSVGTTPQAYELLSNNTRLYQKGALCTTQKSICFNIWIYLIFHYKLGLHFVQIIGTLMVSNAKYALLFCFEIYLFHSQEFISLTGGFLQEWNTSPLCQ